MTRATTAKDDDDDRRRRRRRRLSFSFDSLFLSRARIAWGDLKSRLVKVRFLKK